MARHGRALIIATVLAGAVPGAASAAAPASCSAHGAAYRNGPVRVFLHGARTRTYYLCSAALRTPRAYHVRRITDTEDVPSDYVVRGGRLIYQDFHVATQTELVAWVDLHTGRYREAPIPDEPDVYAQSRAVGREGGIAFVTDVYDRAELVWYAPPGAGSLARPRILVRLTDGDLRQGSLSISGGRVRWRSFDGGRRSAPVGGPPRAVATRLTCGSRARYHREGRVSVFWRAVGGAERAYVCSERLATPRRFLTAPPFTLFAFRRFGRHLLFHVDWGGDEESPIAVGWVDLVTGHEADTSPEVDSLDETVAGPDGGVAIRSGRDVLYAPRAGRGLGGAHRLATIDGPPARHSLSVHGGRVWWRTAAAAEGSAPVPAHRR